MKYSNRAKYPQVMKRLQELVDQQEPRPRILEILQEEFGVPPTTVLRWAALTKVTVPVTFHSDDFKTEVFAYVTDGHSKLDASRKFGVSQATIARWMEQAGVKGTYKMKGRPPQKRDRNIDQVLELSDQGLSVYEIAEKMPEPINPGTIGDWIRATGRKAVYYAPSGEVHQLGEDMIERARELYEQGVGPSAIARELDLSISTVSLWSLQGGWDRQFASIPVGRKRDPSKWQTWICQNPKCPLPDRKFETRKSSGVRKFHNNSCANAVIKARQDEVLDDGTGIQSGWERTVYSICKTAKIAIERFDRKYEVQWRGSNSSYAPDFWLPHLKIAIEVKGIEDSDDQTRWAAYREQRGSLAVFSRHEVMTISPTSAKQMITQCSMPA